MKSCHRHQNLQRFCECLLLDSSGWRFIMPPDHMSQQHSSLAILFADVAKSTHLFEAHGNERAQKIIAHAIHILSDVAHDHGGVVIKTIGDEVMCSFPLANKAAMAACAMQEAVIRSRTLCKYGVCIRIGLHFGDVVFDESKDVFGDAVNVAARMVGIAKAREIITTQATREKMPPVLREHTRCLDRIKVKGKEDTIEVYEMLWQEDTSELTLTSAALPAMLSPAAIEKKKSPVLELIYDHTTIQAGTDKPLVLLGRDKQNDIVAGRMDEKGERVSKVSRHHASVEFRKDKFILADHSRNGTGIHTQKGESFFVHREEFPLHGEGTLLLGGTVSKEGVETVQYRITDG